MHVSEEYGVPVSLESEQEFLKVRETLTRMGIASFNPAKTGPKGKALIQSCHILRHRDDYSIVHFKELFKMEGKDKFLHSDSGEMRETIITEDDLGRRNAIALLLEHWGLLKILDKSKIEGNIAPISKIKIIPFKEKRDWNLVSKHSYGKAKKVP